MNPPQTLADPRLVTRARIAVSAVFLLMGVGTGLWAVHIPLVQARLSIDPATLGLALFVMAIGAVVSMPLAGFATSHLGSRPPTAAGAVAYTIAMALPILAPSVLLFFCAAFLFGLTLGFVDVAANVQASEVETARGTPTMSSFHGFFSLGGLTGAVVGAGILAIGWGDGRGAVAVAIAMLALAVWSSGHLLTVPPHASGPRFALPGRAALGLGVLAMLAYSAEGAVTDWSALFLTVERQASEAEAAAGFALFSLAMAICRLVGDPIVARFGTTRVVIGGGLLITLGLAITLASPWVALSAAGFLLVGVGAANIVPVLFSAAARVPGVPPGVGVAAVASLGYFGFLTAPPALGFIAHDFGYSATLAVVGLMGVAIAVLGAARR